MQQNVKGVRMIDELKEEGIVNKVGGRFKLSTLIQKRMVALNTGARPLVDLKTNDKLTIVVQEILQNKIFLDQSGNLVMRGTSAGDAVRRAMLTDISDVGGSSDD
jgi:DNA-directed RNA polymerase subunit omega